VRVAIAERGVHNFLVHAGILRGELIDAPSQLLDMPSGDCYVSSLDDGLYEPCVDLGARVCAGDLLARVYPTKRTGEPASEYRAKLDGLLAQRHFPGLVQLGDCLAVVAVPEG
jgi:N-alpha-acetyl-L-2,4-diaminobutyrate deacetylase